MFDCCFKNKASIDISEHKDAPKEIEDHDRQKRKTFTRAEVAEHAFISNCWIILGEPETGLKVYDVSKYMKKHPGGSAVILEVAGQDAQRGFILAGHSTRAYKSLEALCIGDLVEGD